MPTKNALGAGKIEICAFTLSAFGLILRIISFGSVIHQPLLKQFTGD